MNKFQIDERIQNILNNIHAGVLYCANDQHSTILYANDYFYTMIGFTKEEVQTIYQNRFAEMVLDDVSKILVNVAATIERGEDLDYEYRMRRKDGSIIWIHDTARYDKENNCFYVTIMDITAMKSMTHEHAKVNNYLYHLPGKIIISDIDGTIVYKNQTAEACEYLDPEVSNLVDLIGPHLIGIDPEDIRSHLKKGERIQYETRFREGDHILGHDKNYVVPIYDEHHKILNYMQVSETLLNNSDTLTNFPTRAMFEYYYSQLVSNARLTNAFLCIVDIDNFKTINDTYGHVTGDEAIKLTARRLTKYLEKEDYICRYGGDEFILLMTHTNQEEIRQKFEELIGLTKAPVLIDGHEFSLTYSIGIAAAPADPISYTELMKRADSALYEVKIREKGTMLIR